MSDLIQWEYLVRRYGLFPASVEKRLNDDGLNGWELVAVKGDLYIFKRPIAGEDA